MNASDTKIAEAVKGKTQNNPLTSKQPQSETNSSTIRKEAHRTGFELLLIYQEELQATLQEGIQLIHQNLFSSSDQEVPTKEDFFNQLRNAQPLNSGQNLQLGGSKPKSLPRA